MCLRIHIEQEFIPVKTFKKEDIKSFFIWGKIIQCIQAGSQVFISVSVSVSSSLSGWHCHCNFRPILVSTIISNFISCFISFSILVLCCCRFLVLLHFLLFIHDCNLILWANFKLLTLLQRDPVLVLPDAWWLKHKWRAIPILKSVSCREDPDCWFAPLLSASIETQINCGFSSLSKVVGPHLCLHQLPWYWCW